MNKTEHTTPKTAKTTRGNERCAMIMAVATDLFIKHGYQNVSLDQVVEKAGGSKATIYKFYDNKKGLFLRICYQRCDNFIQQIEDAFSYQDQDLVNQLNHLLYNLYQVFTEDASSSFLQLLVQTSQENPDIAQELYNNSSQKVYMLLTKYLQQAQEQNLIYCENTMQSAQNLMGFFHDIYWRRLIGLSITEPEQEIKAKIQYTVKCFIKGHQKD